MTAALHRLQRALEGRYTVEHELGRGGMAVVFLGKDERLGRRVAIKVFEREADLGAHAERFLREIRVAAHLQHPNILPVFESGEGEGLVYYVMPYVAGASLRERIEREGPLPVADAVRIAREVAEALDHAHRAGIVHRDVKPDNILLADGVAVVADFGIARALVESGTTVTDAGLALGTPLYMSPEQAAASPTLDGRTDIYSLGCVLYEMLSGAPPFNGTTPQVVMARHATDAVPPLATVRTLPPGLEDVVHRALAKLPADRWATGRAMADALSALGGTTGAVPAPAIRPSWMRWAAAAVVLSTATLAAVLLRGRLAASEADESRLVTVAVSLPEYKGDTAYANLAAWLREALVTGLANVPGLSVKAGGSPAIGGAPLDPLAIGRESGADVVVTASFTTVGRFVRIVPRVLNVADGSYRWGGQSYSGAITSPEDLFNNVDSIAVEIVGALVPRLSPEQRRLAARGVGTRNPEALRLVANARTLLNDRSNTNRTKFGQVIMLLRRAVALDSTYADAWVELAEAVDGSVILEGTATADASPEIRGYLDRAISIDSTNARAYELLGRVSIFYDYNWDEAHNRLRRAVQLAPGTTHGIEQLCWLLHFMNEGDSALAYARRHVALDSVSAASWENLSYRFLFLGMLDSAVIAGLRARSISQFHGVEPLFHAYLADGRQQDALRLLESLPEDHLMRWMLSVRYYRATGDPPRAREWAQRIYGFFGPDSPVLMEMRLLEGDREEAIAALVEAARVRARGLPFGFPRLYEWLKGDPRVEEVRRKVYGNRTPPPGDYVGRPIQSRIQ